MQQNLPRRSRYARQQRSVSHKRAVSSLHNGTTSNLVDPVTLTGGGIEWTRTECYSITRLPAWPAPLRTFDAGTFNGYIDSGTRHALLLSPSAAHVWQYTSTQTLPTTLSFPLHADDASLTALGCFIRPSAGTDEPGLVIALSGSGQIAYWEAVGGAVAEGLMSRRRGVEGQLQLVTGESIVGLCNAEPAGLVLWTTNGRLFLVLLRDGAGHPCINVVTMRSGGILGALRPQAARRDLVCLRTGRLQQRGEVTVVSINRHAAICWWVISRSGSYRQIYELELRNNLIEAISTKLPTADVHEFVVADLALDSSHEYSFYLLLRAAGVYIICHLDIRDGTPHISWTKALMSYTSHSTSPRLHASPSNKTLQVVFENAIVLLSRLSGDPSAQEARISFKSAISLLCSDREDAVMTSTGQNDRDTAIVLLTRSAGVLRCEIDESDQALQSSLKPKSRLEQGVFYSFLDQNPLDFSLQTQYEVDDVMAAAVELSQEILCSACSYLPPFLPSLEDHLNVRGKALARLANYVFQEYPNTDDSARCMLRYDAEKCEAAKCCWVTWDKRVQRSGRASSGSVLAIITAQGSSGPDPVRAWFLTRVNDMGLLIPWAHRECVRKASKSKADPFEIAESIVEANECIVATLAGAFGSREIQKDLYGLPAKSQGLPSPWTSSLEILSALSAQISLTRKILSTIGHEDNHTSQAGNPDAHGHTKPSLEAQLVGLTEISFHSYLEQDTWCNSQNQPALEKQAQGVHEAYQTSRLDWLRSLVEIGRADKAFEIAERYQDFEALVELCHGERTETEEERTDILRRIEYYFERYGERFAFVLYQYYIENDNVDVMLEQFPSYRHYLTDFLQQSKYDNVAWMHFVTIKDFRRSAEILHRVALIEGGDIERKKVATSIAKLCFIADADEADGADLQALDDNLHNIHIQKQLLKEMKQVATGAIDLDAAVELATKEWAAYLRKKPALIEVLKDCVTNLYGRKALRVRELVDLLTLKSGSATNLSRPAVDQFYLALSVLCNAELHEEQRDSLERTIWRRCYLYDDWSKIVDTKHKTDAAVRESSYHTALFSTIKMAIAAGILGPESDLAILRPGQCFLMDDVKTVKAMYGTHSATAEAIHADLSKENETLTKYQSKRQLEDWFEAIIAASTSAAISDNDASVEDDEEEDYVNVEMGM